MADDMDLAAEIDHNIGANLKRAREKLGMSQAELAKLIDEAGVRGIHQTTIARVESGQRSLRAAEAIAVARLLETSLEWLAESGDDALLRSEVFSLQEKASAFDDAGRELVHARRVAAQHLDRLAPYGPEGFSSASDLVRAGVAPDLIERLEKLIHDASPRERLRTIYWNEARQPRSYFGMPGLEHPQRLEMIFMEYREGLTGDGFDQAED